MENLYREIIKFLLHSRSPGESWRGYSASVGRLVRTRCVTSPHFQTTLCKCKTFRNQFSNATSNLIHVDKLWQSNTISGHWFVGPLCRSSQVTQAPEGEWNDLFTNQASDDPFVIGRLVESKDPLPVCNSGCVPLFPAGLSAETHLLLEHVFCGHELHSSAASSLLRGTVVLLLMVSTFTVLHMMDCL